MLGDELVPQDGAVVADQFSAHAAIVVLVPHAPAAAGVVPAVTDQALFLLVPAVLPVGHPSTGSSFALEARGGGNHRSPSVGLGRADRPPARGSVGCCACEPMGASSTVSTFPGEGSSRSPGLGTSAAGGAGLACRQPTVPTDESRGGSMAQFVKVARTADLAADEAKRVEVAEEDRPLQPRGGASTSSTTPART